ncbi:MAG: right-handed parallel beta-helix repeat-containing protein [Myxococcales bacterium]|nr:right-handed parallel beta-helix repeat-containing protein [Myxococcales bacterium]
MRRHTQIARLAACAFLAPWFATCSSGGSSHHDAVVVAQPVVIELQAGPDLEFQAQEAAVSAKPGTTIVFPAGRFEIHSDLSFSVSHVTLRGQGMDETFLSFANQDSGAQGILATADVFTVEDLTIEDTPGDGIKVEGANHVTFRRVRVVWTGGPDELNGSYGLYPVQCRNVLVEDSIVSGASDAGIYVGQSENIIVRRSRAEFNVAGIEIENSKDADVYDNVATNNAGGILVFDLPNLAVQGGRHTRVFDNQIFENNTPNFAPAGNIVGIVPAGTGILVMANDDIEVFGNEILDNQTVPIAVISYLITGIPITDENYDPVPERLNIHDNIVNKSNNFTPDDSEFGFLLNLLFLFSPIGEIADVVYDGITTPDGSPGELPADRRICIRGNADPDGNPATFGNLHLAPTDLGIPLPTQPLTYDLTPHDCAYDPLEPIVLEDAPEAPVTPGDDRNVVVICGAGGQGVNWPAFDVDCPRLSNYRLFTDSTDPRTGANPGGVPFDLTTPLFSDYALKYRFAFIPPGQKVVYNGTDTLDFPVGTIIAKTFSFADDLRAPTTENVVETRLLIRRETGWVGLPFIWDHARGDAFLSVGGGAEEVAFTDFQGQERAANYRVPNKNQCMGCHAGGAGTAPIGPKARYLNRDFNYPDVGPRNQLTRWTELGILTGAPADPMVIPRVPVWNNPADGTLNERARGYLEINCAHCHSGLGRARTSGLFLTITQPQNTQLGICKPPVAAGRGAGNLDFDIVPGEPDQSILVYRLNSADPGIEMPELSKSLVHTEGVALIREWIESLTGECGG